MSVRRWLPLISGSFSCWRKYNTQRAWVRVCCSSWVFNVPLWSSRCCLPGCKFVACRTAFATGPALPLGSWLSFLAHSLPACRSERHHLFGCLLALLWSHQSLLCNLFRCLLMKLLQQCRLAPFGLVWQEYWHNPEIFRNFRPAEFDFCRLRHSTQCGDLLPGAGELFCGDDTAEPSCASSTWSWLVFSLVHFPRRLDWASPHQNRESLLWFPCVSGRAPARSAAAPSFLRESPLPLQTRWETPRRPGAVTPAEGTKSMSSLYTHVSDIGPRTQKNSSMELAVIWGNSDFGHSDFDHSEFTHSDFDHFDFTHSDFGHSDFSHFFNQKFLLFSLNIYNLGTHLVHSLYKY